MSDPTTAPASAPRKLTEAEWTEAKTLYELGRATKADLARKFNVTRQAIHAGLEARGAVYGSKSAVVAEATIDASKSDAQRRVEEVQAMREKQRKLIETTQQLAAKQMMDAIRDGVPIHSRANDIKALKNLMAIFAAGRAELWEIYGLNDDKDAGEELPEFAVSEYTEEDLALIHAKQTGGDADAMLEELQRQVEEGGGDDLSDLLGEDGEGA